MKFSKKSENVRLRTYEEYFDGIEALQTCYRNRKMCQCHSKWILSLSKKEVLSNIGELRCTFVLVIEMFHLSETTKSCKLVKRLMNLRCIWGLIKQCILKAFKQRRKQKQNEF